MRQISQFKWKQYLQTNRKDIKIRSFETWCSRNRPKKSIFDTEQELLQTLQLYDNRYFKWKQYLQTNRKDIKIRSFETWCCKNRPKKSVFDNEQELLETLQLYDNRYFKWRQYLEYNRPDISIVAFSSWCHRCRPKKEIFDTEQELIQALQLYNNNKRIFSQFDWRTYIKENRHDINIINFTAWCVNNRPKKSIFDNEQELLETLQLYDNMQNKNSDFKWRQYLKENRTDIFEKIKSFTAWCDKNRPKRQIFDTEQELLQAISMYDLWYSLCNKYIVRKTKYQGIYNLTEKETGLKFNFYKLGDMLGLIQ